MMFLIQFLQGAYVPQQGVMAVMATAYAVCDVALRLASNGNELKTILKQWN
jgi:hypothetical protein